MPLPREILSVCLRGRSAVEVLEDEEPAKRELWIRIRDAVKEVLDSTTLEDLASYTDGEQEAYMFYI